jgi:hypothetical protein
MAYGKKSGGMKKMGGKGAAPKFTPCKGCPTPMACKRKGKCMAKAKK